MNVCELSTCDPEELMAQTQLLSEAVAHSEVQSLSTLVASYPNRFHYARGTKLLETRDCNNVVVSSIKLTAAMGDRLSRLNEAAGEF